MLQIDELFENIDSLNTRDKKWLKMYRYACEYYREHGNLLIPPSYSIQVNNEIINLGIWIKTQRRKQKNKPLSKEKIELLESIGMVWTVDVEEKNNNIWFEKFEYAKEYYEEYGNLLIPRNYSFKVGDRAINLGTWINTQKANYRKNELSKEKIDLLESIGMVWKIKVININGWDYMFQKATQYYEQHGDLLVPRLFSFEENNKIINLGAWISNQRQDYKFKRISQERIDLLESIGMVWVVRTKKDKTSVLNKKWENMYNSAKDYYETYGDLLIPSKYSIQVNDEIINLGTWISYQRRKYKNKRLSKEKIELLESIGMVWKPRNSLNKKYVDDSDEKIKNEADCFRQHVNIGTIGYVDHDKITLAPSIMKELSKNNSPKQLVKTAKENKGNK